MQAGLQVCAGSGWKPGLTDLVALLAEQGLFGSSLVTVAERRMLDSKPLKDGAFSGVLAFLVRAPGGGAHAHAGEEEGSDMLLTTAALPVLSAGGIEEGTSLQMRRCVGDFLL